MVVGTHDVVVLAYDPCDGDHRSYDDVLEDTECESVHEIRLGRAESYETKLSDREGERGLEPWRLLDRAHWKAAEHVSDDSFLPDSRATYGNFFLSLSFRMSWISRFVVRIATSSINRSKKAERVIASYAVCNDGVVGQHPWRKFFEAAIKGTGPTSAST